MKVVSYTVGELATLLDQECFQGSGEIPISPLRAQAHFYNPRADKSDRVLWCLFSDGTLLAYRLLLPSTLSDGKTTIKMAWNSCLWVHPNHRGKGYGKQLANLALEEWDKKLMFVNAAPASMSLYSNLEGCREMYCNEGIRYFFTSELATILPKKKPVLDGFSFLIKPFDFAINLIAKMGKKEQTLTQNYSWVRKLSAKDLDFIQQFNEDSLHKIGAAELKWFVDYPWVIESTKKNPYTERYHFSLQYPVYENYFIKIEEAGKLAAIALLKNKDMHFTVHYVWAQVSSLDKVAQSIISVIENKQAKTLSIYHNGLIKAMENLRVSCLYKRDTVQKFMAYSGIPNLENGDKECFQYGDGDSVFT